MTSPLYVVGGGAVTPVGLDAPQTCAGIRARMSRFEEVLRSSPFGKPQAVARIPAHWALRRTPAEWLVSLAARAVAEVVRRHELNPRNTALVVIPPEAFRQEAFLERGSTEALAKSISAKAALQFESVWDIAEGGAAAIASGLSLAARCLEQATVTNVVVGGVDSYVLEAEYARLDAAGRLRTEGTAQGFTPGEAAAFLLISRKPSPVSAAIVGWAGGTEPLSATSDKYSQGLGMLAALRSAATGAKMEERAVDWAVSNANGERYASWEAVLARGRFYRTHRDRLPTIYPAMSVGETGSASGALALLVAAHGFARGYSPGSTAMIELASEGSGRAACVVIDADAGTAAPH